MGEAGRRLLGIGSTAEHLADSLGDGVTVDTIDLEQLVWFSTAGNVGDSQTMQSDARFIDHCRAHRLPKATCGKTAHQKTGKTDPSSRPG